MKIDNCNALITGASAGIGREFARQLTGRVRSLVLVARREERLSELRDELTRNHSDLTVHIRKIDLANLSQVEELIAWLEREKIDVDLLINNAGLGDLGPFATSDPARNEQIMLVNVIALTSLTRRLLPQMIAKKRGAILNVSSSAGFLPIPGFAVYAATKAYVNSFSEALRAELRGTGVSVCTLCPGPVPHRISGSCKTSGRSARRRPGICLRFSRERRARRARRDRGRPTARDSRFRHENRHVSRPHNANADLAMGWRFSAKRGKP